MAWITQPFNAAEFTAYGSAVWTVAAANVTTNAYELVGNTMLWTVELYGTSLSAETNGLKIKIPAGKVPAKAMPGIAYIYDNNDTVSSPGQSTVCVPAPGFDGTWLSIYLLGGKKLFPSSGKTHLVVQVNFEVS